VRWGAPLFVDRLAPSRARDAAYRAWWAELLRNGATPRSASARYRADATCDVRALLPQIAVPTLVAHRRGDRFRAASHARAWAAAIPGARLAIQPGDDHVPWLGDRDALLAELDAFVRAID
jgi:pimeloyl-ACP methyl ester carboxylesterase